MELLKLKKKGSLSTGLGEQIAVLLVVVGIWQLVSISGLGGPALNKGPADVWEAFVELVADGSLLTNLVATLKAFIIALVLATIVGVAIGLTLAVLPRVERGFRPLLSGLNSMPRVALAPLFIIIFGIGVEAKVALAFSLVVFILIINTLAGVKSADPDVMRMAFAMAVTRRQKFFKLLLPVAMPSIFGGIRLGVIYSMLGVVTSEMISSKDGLGQLISQYSAMFQLSKVYAILIVLALVASLLNSVAGIVENRVLRWQVSIGN